jgi:hypothetical protein
MGRTAPVRQLKPKKHLALKAFVLQYDRIINVYWSRAFPLSLSVCVMACPSKCTCIRECVCVYVPACA